MNLAMHQWQEDTTTLAALRRMWGDKLTIDNGRLQLEKGTNYFNSDLIIVPNPLVIADHLEALIKNTAQECFKSLQSSSHDSPDFYEKIADFKRQSKCLCTSISDLQYNFKSNANKNYADRYSQLYDLAATLKKQIKDYKSTLNKPPLSARPIKHIEYDERTELRSIKWDHSKRVPVAETVEAAKKALLLAQPKPQTRFIKCMSFIATGVKLAFPALLTVLKIILWNPIELLIRGEVRTISPLRMILEESRNDNRHMRAYQNFSTQLLHQAVITDKVVEAFKELAPQANHLDLESAILAADDITELAPFIEEDNRPGAIPLTIYLTTLKEVCVKNNIEHLHTLHAVSVLYKLHNDIYLKPNQKKKDQSIEDFLQEKSDSCKKFPNVFKACAIQPYISPKGLQELLNTASSSRTCGKITLSSSLIELQFVRNFLNQHSYRLIEDGENKKIYRRYSLI